jgi:hypothetical protein
LPDEATRRRLRFAPRVVVPIVIAAAAIGVFSAWTTDGPVSLNGTQGPNNGWLVLIVGGFALGWTGSLVRGSWFAVAGVLGAAIVMGWTAVENWLDNRDVFGSHVSYGLILVVAASVALAASAVVRGMELRHRQRGA